jgi:competence protein ComGC
VKDDTIFNRVEQALNKSGQQIVRVDKTDLKMRTLSLPLPLPIQLRPTIAASGGYLFIATTDSMIQEVLAVKNGQKPGLKTGDEFKRLARDIPQQGNQFSFVSQRFGETIMDVQRQALAMAAKAQPAQQQWLQSFLRSDKAMFSYCVSANTADGWLSVGNGNQHPAKLLLASTVVVPIGMLSAIAIPNFVKARQTAQQNSCINNLHQIENAKQQWALENNKKSTDVPTQSDIQPFIDRAPKGTSLTCPSGGHYTIGAVNEPPTCNIPGHTLNGN